MVSREISIVRNFIQVIDSAQSNCASQCIKLIEQSNYLRQNAPYLMFKYGANLAPEIYVSAIGSTEMQCVSRSSDRSTETPSISRTEVRSVIHDQDDARIYMVMYIFRAICRAKFNAKICQIFAQISRYIPSYDQLFSAIRSNIEDYASDSQSTALTPHSRAAKLAYDIYRTPNIARIACNMIISETLIAYRSQLIGENTLCRYIDTLVSRNLWPTLSVSSCTGSVQIDTNNITFSRESINYIAQFHKHALPTILTDICHGTNIATLRAMSHNRDLQDTFLRQLVIMMTDPIYCAQISLHSTNSLREGIAKFRAMDMTSLADTLSRIFDTQPAQMCAQILAQLQLNNLQLSTQLDNLRAVLRSDQVSLAIILDNIVQYYDSYIMQHVDIVGLIREIFCTFRCTPSCDYNSATPLISPRAKSSALLALIDRWTTMFACDKIE